MKTILYVWTFLFVILLGVGCSKEQKTAHQQYSIEQFMNTKSYIGGTFTFDEKRILFSSDESGIFNIYSISTHGENQTQLTNSTHQAIMVLSGFPHDDRFLYTTDELGNERNHIFLREGDGTTRDLTPFPGARSEFYGWSHNQKSFYFGTNERDPKYMDVYEIDIDTFNPTLIFENTKGYQFGDISPDKRYIAMSKTNTMNDSDIFLYDLSSQTLTNIAPHKGDIHFSPLAFSLDSQTLYFLTDENSDFLYLKKFDLATEQSETVEKYDWDISNVSFSYHGRYRITNINEDGKTTLQVFDQETGKPLKLPYFSEGQITNATVSKSEKYILFSVNGDRSPGNLYLYNIEKNTYRQLTNSLSPDVNSNDLVEAEIIRYPSYDGKEIPALFYKPKVAEDGVKVPALIWVHGGPGGQSRTGYNYLIQYLVNHGYAVLAVNNRGSSGYGKEFYKAADLKHGEADLDDCMAAKGFLLSTGIIEEDRVGIIGGSYGGYMTLAALAFRPNEMACGVDIFGVSNWVRTLKNIPEWWESEREALYKKVGNPETDEEYLKTISPLFHAQNIRKPLLVLQGANDPRVLKAESDQIIEEVSKNAIPYRYVVFDDEGHGFAKKQNRLTAGKTILGFLEEHLKKSEQKP